MSTKKKVLIGVGIFIALLVAGAITAVLMTGGDRKNAEQFVVDISAGDTSSAYQQFSDALKNVQDFDTFESQVATLSLDTSCKLSVTGVEASTSNGNTITGYIKCSDKQYDAEFNYTDGKLLGYSMQ